MLISAGVFPVYENSFKIEIASEYTSIVGLETIEPSFEGNVQEWSTFDDEGWSNSLMTGKKWSLSVSGKRTIGDPGNDFVESKLMAKGQDAYVNVKWIMPSGMTITQKMTISVTKCGSGGTTDVGPLEFELTSCGKPTVLYAQKAPTGLVGAAPASSDGEGTISTTTTAMEYRAVGETEYTTCSATSTSVEGGADYYVRFKETATKAASPDATVSVPAYSA